MSGIDYEALGRLAERWVLAEAKRKMTRSDRGMACAVLDNAMHCPKKLSQDCDRNLFVPESNEQREWHQRMLRIGREYDAVYPVARGLRAAMTRIVAGHNEMPASDAELSEAVRALHERMMQEAES